MMAALSLGCRLFVTKDCTNRRALATPSKERPRLSITNTKLRGSPASEVAVAVPAPLAVPGPAATYRRWVTFCFRPSSKTSKSSGRRSTTPLPSLSVITASIWTRSVEIRITGRATATGVADGCGSGKAAGKAVSSPSASTSRGAGSSSTLDSSAADGTARVWASDPDGATPRSDLESSRSADRPAGAAACAARAAPAAMGTGVTTGSERAVRSPAVRLSGVSARARATG